jgi:hypothetical protein
MATAQLWLDVIKLPINSFHDSFEQRFLSLSRFQSIFVIPLVTTFTFHNDVASKPSLAVDIRNNSSKKSSVYFFQYSHFQYL